MGDLEHWMHPVQRCSSRNALSSFCSSRFRGYTLHPVGSEPGFNSMAWSQGHFGGKVSNSAFSKTSSKPLYCSGMGSVFCSFWIPLLVNWQWTDELTWRPCSFKYCQVVLDISSKSYHCLLHPLFPCIHTLQDHNEPVVQSTSGLWKFNHSCPKNMSDCPRLVTANFRILGCPFMIIFISA